MQPYFEIRDCIMTWCRTCFMLSTRMKEPANVCRSLAWEVATSGRDVGSETKKKNRFWVFLAVEINHGLIKTLSGGTRIRGIMTTSYLLNREGHYKPQRLYLMLSVQQVNISTGYQRICRKCMRDQQQRFIYYFIFTESWHILSVDLLNNT